MINNTKIPMKNIIKNTAYSAVALSSVLYSYTNTSAEGSADLFNKQGAERLSATGETTGSVWNTVVSIMQYLLWFLALIAVVFVIYGWFQILTAGWDEDRVKKWKTTLINALIGVFVIWISWALVSWVIGGLSETGAQL